MVVVGGVLSISAVALLSFVYSQHMVAAQYASGERVSTDGDSLGIPVFGVTLAWTSLLFAVGAVYAVVKAVKSASRNDTG